METLLQDMRYSFRVMRKSPILTIAAVIALALGIGANTAIFSVVNAVLLRPLRYKDSDRIARLWMTEPQKGAKSNYFAAPNYIDIKDQNQVFEEIAAFRSWPFTITGRSEPITIWGQRISPSLFSLLRVTLEQGRAFLPEEELEAKNAVVILNHRFWQKEFGGDPGVLGQTLLVNNVSRTIVGVTPPKFDFPDANTSAIYIPLTFNAWELNRAREYMSAIGRLKPGASLTQAQVNIDTIAKQLEQQYPGINAGKGMRVISLHEDIAGDIRPSLLILFGSVGFVLLIACANVANLLLARAMARQKEIAIRSALGASRRRLIRQFLTESVLLSLIGGVAGLVLAYWALNLIINLSADRIPLVKEATIDVVVLGFTLAVAVLMGLIFGLAPALQSSNPDVNSTLKEAVVSSGSVRRHRVRNLLMVSEIAFAIVLLIGAGLMIKSFLTLQNVNPGFNTDDLVVTSTFLSQTKYPQTSQQATFYKQVLQKIEAVPGVQSVGATSMLPFSGRNNPVPFTIEGGPSPASGEQFITNYRVISPNYFLSMGIPLLRGRDFGERDNDQGMNVAIISETMAKRFFESEDPIGKRLLLSDVFNRPCEVVGMVGDVKFEGLTAGPEPEVYVPYLQRPWLLMNLIVRTPVAPTSIALPIRQAIWSVDKDQPVERGRSMSEDVAKTISAPRFNMVMLGIFAGVALILAAVGIYGVVSYSVTQRTNEIALRIALGAGHEDILKLVMGQAMMLALVGIVAGLIGAFILTRILSSLLFGVSTTDPGIFAGIPLLLCALVMVASYLPARKALRIDPMLGLKHS